jgi:hypothetical protein
MPNRLATTGLLLMALTVPASAQSVAGSYEVKFEEMSTNCDPVRFTYTRSVVRIGTPGKSSLTVNIETIPQMVGVPAKSGKVNAKTPKKVATTIDGVDGKYGISGRVDDEGVLELVLVAELFRKDNGKPLCTQSWNLRGVRQAPEAKPDPKKPDVKQKKAAFDFMPSALSED